VVAVAEATDTGTMMIRDHITEMEIVTGNLLLEPSIADLSEIHASYLCCNSPFQLLTFIMSLCLFGQSLKLSLPV